MRPQQHNRRMRVRNNNNNNNGNNNRKGPNPLTRSYESNGPDVKIRGSAQQIAEKYTTLARDTHSSGDRVMAENYLQHAEHYNRIVAAAIAQMPIQQQQQSRDESNFDSDVDEERDDDMGNNNAADASVQQPHGQQHKPVVNGSVPQPEIEGTPAEVDLNPKAAGGPSRESCSEPRPRNESRRPERRQPKQEVEQQQVEDVWVEAAQPEAAPIEMLPIVVAEGEVETPRYSRRLRRGEHTRAEGEAAAAGASPFADTGVAVVDS